LSCHDAGIALDFDGCAGAGKKPEDLHEGEAPARRRLASVGLGQDDVVEPQHLLGVRPGPQKVLSNRGHREPTPAGRKHSDRTPAPQSVGQESVLRQAEGEIGGRLLLVPAPGGLELRAEIEKQVV